MTDKPNCSNCPNTSCWNNIIRQEKILTLEQSLETRVSYVAVRDHTKIHGCLSHPGTKEWMMGDMIEKLNEQKERAEMEYKSAQAYGFKLERKGRYKALGEAIAIIKGGCG